MEITKKKLVFAVVAGSLVGPLTMMANLPDGALASVPFWDSVGSEAVRSGAAALLAVGALMASSMGVSLPKRSSSTNEGEGA